MRQIVLNSNLGTINISVVRQDAPVFAKKNGKINGFAVKEEDGWILRIGGSGGWNGHHHTLEDLIKSCPSLEFFTE